MTNEQMSILAAELDRVVKFLPTLDPSTVQYKETLYNIMSLNSFVTNLKKRENSVNGDMEHATNKKSEPTPDERAADPENIEESSEAAREPEPAPVEEPTPEPVKPCPKPEHVPTKQEMVTQLSYYANEKNVDVAAIMAGMGYARLSDIPQSQYNELLDLVKEAG